MSKEDFYRDLRRAERFRRRPSLVSTGVPTYHPEMSTGRMPNTALWLSPECVAAFRASDFKLETREIQAALQSKVDEFRDVSIRFQSSPTLDESHRGQELFDAIVSIVKKIVLSEWGESVQAVIEQAEAWCAAREWPSRRYETHHEETLLGDHPLPWLRFQVEEAQIDLRTVARFVPGAYGMMELSVVPSYDSVKVFKEMDDWWARLEEGETSDARRALTWDENGFCEAVRWLRSHG